MSTHILIVEDEPELAETLAYNLSKEGFRTTICHTGTEALKVIESVSDLSLVLLDLMLPDMSGIEVCRQIRMSSQSSQLAVIMVTARSEEIDRVIGFEAGADDYVVKPFSARELVLRIHAVLRRGHVQDTEQVRISLPPFVIDRAAHRVWVDDEELILTALEFRLLTTLVTRYSQVQTRARLLEDVWDMDPNVNTRTVDKHVQRLRQKIGSAADLIETIRGVGYRLNPKESDA